MSSSPAPSQSRTRRPAYKTPPRQRSVFEPNELQRLRRKNSDSYSNSLYANRNQIMMMNNSSNSNRNSLHSNNKQKNKHAKRRRRATAPDDDDDDDTAPTRTSPSSPTKRLGKFLGRKTPGMVSDQFTTYVLKKSLEQLGDWE